MTMIPRSALQGTLKEAAKHLKSPVCIYVSSVCVMYIFYVYGLGGLHTLYVARNHRATQESDLVQFLDKHGLSYDELREFSINRRLEHYPRNGTGISVDVSEDFDPNLFNSFCTTDPQLRVILPIYSRTDRFKSRNILRDSLGKLGKKLHCKIFFIIGVSTNETEYAMLKEEYMRERDILMVGKLDTYRDLNNKAFAMIEWISKYCTHASYVIHLIDDSYIDLNWFLQRLDAIQDRLYILAPMANTPTVRIYLKSFVTVEEYPFPRFPPYAYGWVFAFPVRVAARLMTAVDSATYCWIEDVWIGGHLRISAGVKLIPVPDKEWVVSHYRKQYTEPIPTVRVIHGVDDDLLHRFYHETLG